MGEDHEVLTAGTNGFAEEHAMESLQGIDAVLAGGGDVAADPPAGMRAGAAEVHECLETAEGAGDFLAQPNHPQVSFRLVVVEGQQLCSPR